MSRPVVGLTTYARDGDGVFGLPSAYVDAVRRAGGLPVLLAPGEPSLAQWLDGLDALVLTGGGDLATATWGGAPHPTVYGVDADRDRDELACARAVTASGLPALCICRGAQVLNVALGGTLITHLPDAVGDAVPHRAPDGTWTFHPVAVTAGSLTAEVLGETELPAPASWHHQAIDRLAAGLEVVARAPDGTIEAVEMPSHPWLLAPQWHPEITAADDAAQQRLFDALVAVAR